MFFPNIFDQLPDTFLALKGLKFTSDFKTRIFWIESATDEPLNANIAGILQPLFVRIPPDSTEPTFRVGSREELEGKDGLVKIVTVPNEDGLNVGE